MLRAIGLLLPLGLDTFAVAAALAAGGLPATARLRTTALLTGFEAGMPVVGLAAGGLTGRAVGGAGELAGSGLVMAVGAWMLLDTEAVVPGAGALEGRGLRAALVLGFAVSLDELAIGLAFGLVGVPAALAVTLIAVQAALASQLGLRVGARAGAAVPEIAERIAGIALLVAGGALAAGRLA
jgi:manganese efflux pump family protein